MKLWHALPQRIRLPLVVAGVIAGAIVTGWIAAIGLPFFVAYVLIFGLTGAERRKADETRQQVDDKIRWLLVEHCLEDTPANRDHLMRLRWSYPKTKRK